MAYKNLTAPDDYASRKAAIARQEKLAEMLSQMGAQEQAVSTAGGITAPMSGMGALARGLTSFGGSYLSGKAAEDEAALEESQNKGIADVFEGMKDTPDVRKPGVYTPSEAPTSLFSENESAGSYTPGEFTPGQKLSSSEKTNRIMEALLKYPKIAAVAPMYMQGMRNELEDTRYKTGLDRADAALAVDADRYATGQAKIAADDIESKRRFGITSEISRTNALDNPTMRFVTVTGPDGKPKRVMMSDAQIIAAQTAGKNVSDETFNCNPRFTAEQFRKLGEDLTSDMTTAGRLKDYMKSVGSTPQGFKLIAQDFANKFTTAFGGSLKGDALEVAMQRGTLPQLIGNIRIETVGGGVMTEQDAVRVIQALGGNLGLLRNKDEVEGQIRKILGSKEARIKQNMQFYNRDAEINKVAPMEYTPQNAGSAVGAGSAKPLTESDIQNSMKKNGKTRQEVIDFAKSKGYEIAP